MGHIFISYSKKDILYAEKLVNALRREGFNPWVDVDELGAGTHWQARLHKQINTCDAYVIIMSRNSLRSRWVPDELVTAKSKNKPIFPVLLDETELFLAIQTIQCEDVRGGKLPSESFYEQLAKVTSRNKKAGQKINSVHLVERARQKKVDSRAEKATYFLSKAGVAIADFFAVVFKVMGNLTQAVGHSPFAKTLRSSIQKQVKRTVKLIQQ